MRGTGALARASMADLKPDRVRAAELAQTGAGRGWARGEQAEREHESTRTLLEHDPDFIMRGLRAGKENEDGCCREGWRRAELQWVQRQDARWRSKGGKGVSWRLRQRKQRRRRLATANNAMRRLPARGIGPGTGRQGPLQRGVGWASRRQWQKRLRAGKGGAGASGQQQRRSLASL